MMVDILVGIVVFACGVAAGSVYTHRLKRREWDEKMRRRIWHGRY